MRNFQRIGCFLLVLFAGYLLQIIDGANLIINPSGQTQNQPAGNSFGLTCQGEAEDLDLFTQMKWRGPKGDLTEGSSGPVEVSSMGSTLILMFKSPTTDDSGMYNCTALYDNIDQLSTAVNLIFYQDITWEDCPKQQALVIHSDGKITCRVSANPPATIMWHRHGQPLEERYDTETDGVRVTSVTEEDKGEFVVRAMVPQTGRFQSRTIKVEVHDPPEIIELEDKAEAIEGSETMLHCKASGFPRPLYSWFDHNQRDLASVEGYSVDADTGTLTFLSVKREDQGSYTCKAKNPAGEAERSLDFTVIVKPEIKEFENVTTVENQVATFECHAYGDPPPEMSIRKDGMERPFSDGDDRITLTRRNEEGKAVLTLTIQAVSRSDDGLYYCTAENKGAHVSKVGHLTVEFSPVLSSTPSTLVKTWNGNPVNLTCIAESIPNATITWFFLGQEIRDNDLYTVYGRSAYSNLLVRPPQNFNMGGTSVYGTYKCDASNPHGNQHINIDLQEARTPSELTDAVTEKETATTLTFKFHGPKDDGGLPIRAFVVKYHEENQPYDDVPIMHEWSEGTPYVLEKLKPRTPYRFRFAARNEVGIGKWTDEKRIVMPDESAPEPPKFITPGGNVSTYPDRFQIRWTEPLDNGRKIDFFELRYFEAEHRDNVWKKTGDSVVKKVTDWENAPMYEMKNLKANSFYKVEVRAHNEIGYSQDATMVFQTAAGSGHDTTSDGYYSGSSGSLSYGAIAAIIIVLVLVILLVLDVTCYVRYEWGVLFMLRNRVCAKPINDKAKEAAAEDGKGGCNETAVNNGNVKVDVSDVAVDEKGEKLEEKSRTEVDNPAFDKEKELLQQSKEDYEKDNDGEVATEDTPMIQSSGAKDTKPNDADVDVKNKSPKGSKSSIAKDSLV